MTHGRRLTMRPNLVLRISIAGLVGIVPRAALADDEIRTSADVSSSAGWSSNPFSGTGSDLGSAYAQIDVRPVISLVSEHSVLALSGLFDYEHYFRRYSDSNNYGGGLDYTGAITSRLNTHANAHYESAIIGGFDAFAPAASPTQPQLPVTTGPDIALIGTRARRNTLSFADDAAYTLSARDTLTANAYYNRTHYDGLESGSDYSNYGGGLGYSRRISDRLQLGLQGSASQYVYRGLLGKSQVYSLQATFSDKLSDRWNVSGAVGASLSDQSRGGRRTYLTGNVQLCRAGPRSSLCLNVSDAVLPTGGTGTVNTKLAGASYSYQLTEHSTFSLSGQYSHNDQPAFINPIAGSSVADSYLTLSANYDRQLRRRIHLVASTHYRKLLGGYLRETPADFGGSLGILIRLGDIR